MLKLRQPQLFSICSSGRLKRVLVSVPPLPEQRKIASILTTVDRLIEQTEALIEKYRRIKQGMMADLLSRGVDEHGKLRPTQKQAPQLYKQSELGWIPKEWKVLPLSEVSDRVVVGLALSVTHAYRQKGVPLIRNQNIRRGFFEDHDMLYIDPNFSKLFPNKAVQRDDVLTVRTGSNVGDTSLVPEKYIGSPTFTTLVTSTNKDRLHPQYLVDYVDSNHGQSELNRLLVGGGKENLNVGEFVKMRIATPPIKEQKKLNPALRRLNDFLGVEQSQLAKLRTLKTGLMQDLLTGKVRVKVDQDEKAKQPTPSSTEGVGV